MAKQKIRKYLHILFTIGFLVCALLLVNDLYYQPYRMNQLNDQTKDLYIKPSEAPVNTYPSPTDNTPTGNSIRDEQGRLIYFKELLEKNPDTIGWLNIPDTNIDYVVMQNNQSPLYYLRKNFNKEYQRAGCLFLDENSTIEGSPSNMVIHGHNMRSTNNMFHYLEFMRKLDYFKEHTSFHFDTIYQTGQWKIFSIFITNGSNKIEPYFDYSKTTFPDSSDFLNFIYQLKIRSLYHNDSVKINENDQLVTLSTCIYDLDDYRLVIVARKERPSEDSYVDPTQITMNPSPLYPNSYYKHYKKQAPTIPATFEEAQAQGMINWYDN